MSAYVRRSVCSVKPRAGLWSPSIPPLPALLPSPIHFMSHRQIHGGVPSAKQVPYANQTLQLLAERNLINAVTSTHLSSHLTTQPRTIYLGIDPTAPSLHLGNLVPIMALIWLVRSGHRGVILVGGATASIGDPSGKNTERPAMESEKLKSNTQALHLQLEALLKHVGNSLAADRESSDSSDLSSRSRNLEEVPRTGTEKTLDIRIINNEEFYHDLDILTFLCEVGRFVRIGEVLARDSVKTRLSPPHGTSSVANAGLSYTEVSYQLLQAYDFHVLNVMPDLRVTVQLGGSDQMGNISAGIELIRRKTYGMASSEEQEDSKDLTQDVDSSEKSSTASPSRRLPPAYGLTSPLLTTAAGNKLGKSAGNAIYLSSELCSDYDFYQYLLRTADGDVDALINCLTFLSKEDFAKASQKQKEALRSPKQCRQAVLADEVTRLFRGSESRERARHMTVLLHKDLAECSGLDDFQRVINSPDRQWAGKDLHAQLNSIARESEGRSGADLQIVRLAKSRVIGASFLDLLVISGLATSKGQARLLIRDGGAYLYNVTVPRDAGDTRLREQDIATFDGHPGEAMLFLRRGKNNIRVLLLSDTS